jgi:hypothetical protein
VKELLEVLSKEWGAISGAPFSFLIAVAAVCGLAYAFASWRYKAIIDKLKATIDLKDERLGLKDQQLDGYREQLNLTPARGSEYARLTNSDLRTEVAKFLADLREWSMEHATRRSDRVEQQFSGVFESTDKGQRKRLFKDFLFNHVASATDMSDEYDAKFKVRAIVLRDELLTRVKHPETQSRFHRIYERPMNEIGILAVTDDLEHLVRQLPQA